MERHPHQKIEDMSGYRWWIRRKRSCYFQDFLTILFVLAAFVAGMYLIGFDTFETKEIIFVTVLVLLIFAFAMRQLLLTIKTFTWQIDAYWFGTITDMRRNLKSNKKLKNYRLTADVQGKSMEGICLTKTYYKAEVGQEILLFTIGTDVVYCVHPRM